MHQLGPEFRVKTYSGCVVDGVRFLFEEEDKHRITQNSEVSASETHEGEDMDFQGALCTVFELNFKFGYRIVLFKCKWFGTDPKDHNISTSCNITTIRTRSTWQDDCPFILRNEVHQAFYLSDGTLDYVKMQKVQH